MAAIFANPEKLPEAESKLHRALNCKCKGDLSWHDRRDAEREREEAAS